MRVLITGITGFVGSHLAELCLSRGDVELFGTYRWRSRRENIAHIKDVTLVEMDVLDPASCLHTLRSVRPDWIFHLAAQSFVPTSWSAPASTMGTNVLGQINLFEALRALDRFDTRFHVCGSSEEYGYVGPDETPITEDNPLRPLSPYGVSKVAQDLLGFQYFRSYGLHAVRTRAFNHGGPRRGEVLMRMSSNEFGLSTDQLPERTSMRASFSRMRMCCFSSGRIQFTTGTQETVLVAMSSVADSRIPQ